MGMVSRWPASIRAWISRKISNVDMTMRTDARKIVFLKAGVFAACLVPLGILAVNALMRNLGANPIDEITDQTGIWTLRLLLISLAVTPLRRLTGWNRLIQVRR